MKKQLSYVLISFFFSLFVSGCGDDLAAPEADGNPVPIILKASGIAASTDTEVQTRTTDFPNNGTIAIVAAKTTKPVSDSESSTENNIANNIDWSSNNLYLNHVEATAGTKNASNYPVTLSPVQYWPFNPDEFLTFAAYSPKSAHKAGTDHTLSVTATTSKPFPDLLYSTPTEAYNKDSGKHGVALTQFQHAMARLIIQVTPINKDGKPIENYNNDNFKITKLNIQTKVTTGDFDFIPAPTWTLASADASFTTIYHIIHATDGYADAKAKNLPYDSSDTSKGGSNTEYYLLPATVTNTAALSKIEFELRDKSYTYTYAAGNDGSLDEFKTKDNNNITLQMGKTTILTIKIKVTDIQNGGNDNILLYGTLKDWEYKGDSSITIN